MKWYVWYDKDKGQYQLSPYRAIYSRRAWVAIFQNFDMAYDYVTKANRMTDVCSYSRWAR
jgi:hypothetical protein